MFTYVSPMHYVLEVSVCGHVQERGLRVMPLVRVIDCPAPSSERCLGFNVTTGQTQCGIGYLQGSYLCSACAPRYFTDFYGTCAACPAVATLWQRFSMLVWIVVGILGAVVAVYAFLLGLVWIVGGTLTGGVFRAINLALWCLMTAQVFFRCRGCRFTLCSSAPSHLVQRRHCPPDARPGCSPCMHADLPSRN